MRAAAVATLRGVPRVALAIPPRIRRRIAALLALAVALAAAYLLWFRDSGLVRIDRVTVSGLTTRDAGRIRAALVSSGRDMTTLHVRRDALARSVAGFAVVKAVVAEPDFPHGLRVRVIEERPVAVLGAAGRRLPVAADGSVLRGMHAGGRLPLLGSRASAPGGAVTDPAALAALHAVAAAPPALARRISSVGRGTTRGIVVRLRQGPQIVFGSGSRLDAKWAAAAAVLADAASKGASYVDVRLPERPVAGGLAASSLAPLDTAAGDASAAARGPTSPARSSGAVSCQPPTVNCASSSQPQATAPVSQP